VQIFGAEVIDSSVTCGLPFARRSRPARKGRVVTLRPWH
jgi:hypothetical protein